MKKIFLVVIVLIFVGCATAKLVTLNNPVAECVINPNQVKDELYIKAKEWMVRAFTNAESVIQFQDKAAGFIIGKYLLFSTNNPILNPITSLDGAKVFAIIKIEVKNNAAKITIESRDAWYYTQSNSSLNAYNYSPEVAQKDINALISNFIKHMNKQSDNW